MDENRKRQAIAQKKMVGFQICGGLTSDGEVPIEMSRQMERCTNN